jgi:XapX domain-containing protein
VLYLQSLLAGLVIGAVYAVLRVRSPAPPLTGLTGLAGMLIGFAAAGALL